MKINVFTIPVNHGLLVHRQKLIHWDSSFGVEGWVSCRYGVISQQQVTAGKSLIIACDFLGTVNRNEFRWNDGFEQLRQLSKHWRGWFDSCLTVFYGATSLIGCPVKLHLVVKTQNKRFDLTGDFTLMGSKLPIQGGVSKHMAHKTPYKLRKSINSFRGLLIQHAESQVVSSTFGRRLPVFADYIDGSARYECVALTI